MQRQTKLVKISLILCVAIALMVFARGICDDEDSALEMVCNLGDAFWSLKFFTHSISCSGIMNIPGDCGIAPTSLMAYLARQEKSPPA